MGLTSASTGAGALGSLEKARVGSGDRVVALAGNPNVGKSSIFNRLTGLRQHTGNWPGKTVVTAQGRLVHDGRGYLLVDLPGSYSLLSHSPEEEVARDFLCFGGAQAAVVVCDATCLERNLNLALQVMELCPQTVLCVNLIDEARKHGVEPDCEALEMRFGVPVVCTCAGSGEGVAALMDTVARVISRATVTHPARIGYPLAVERAIGGLEPALEPLLYGRLPTRWVALRLLEANPHTLAAIEGYLGGGLGNDPSLAPALTAARGLLEQAGLGDPEAFGGVLASSAVVTAEHLVNGCVTVREAKKGLSRRRLDSALTGKLTGIPIMLLLLTTVLWLTITGANYPSRLLSTFLFAIEAQLTTLFMALGAPLWLHGMLVLGVYRVLAWVVAVMLPPMAIFFPLFTLLEDMGYLPRVAFQLDHAFQRCRACGKQSLSMCMGFGCNAAGVIGCRIIDSPRERLIAIITNSFIPCNGRFPTLIAIITMFFVGAGGGLGGSVLSAMLLTGVVVLGVVMTFGVSALLSHTLLRGLPSAFTLELPPYRRPRFGQVLVRSVLDRTLFVLGRAVAVAAPAGLIIWLMANLTIGGGSLLHHCAAFLDPLGRMMGMDGVILLAFILGFPANEIVLPIAIMAYTASGALVELNSLTALHTLLVANGWTWLTALCVMLFSLMHWPCSTTCITIRKETGSAKWTAVAFAAPTLCGFVLCTLTAAVVRLL